MFINFYRNHHCWQTARAHSYKSKLRLLRASGCKRSANYVTKVGQVMAFSEATSAFQWHFSPKEHVFGQFINLLSDNYNI